MTSSTLLTFPALRPGPSPKSNHLQAPHITETCLNLIIYNMKGKDAPYLQEVFNFLEVGGAKFNPSLKGKYLCFTASEGALEKLLQTTVSPQGSKPEAGPH